jgi:hypothetical protein
MWYSVRFLSERVSRPGSHAHWTVLVYLLLMFSFHAASTRTKSTNKVEVADMKQRVKTRLLVTRNVLKNIWARFYESKWAVGAEVAAA